MASTSVAMIFLFIDLWLLILCLIRKIGFSVYLKHYDTKNGALACCWNILSNFYEGNLVEWLKKNCNNNICRLGVQPP